MVLEKQLQTENVFFVQHRCPLLFHFSNNPGCRVMKSAIVLFLMVCFAALLSACASPGAQERGQRMDAQAVSNGWQKLRLPAGRWVLTGYVPALPVASASRLTVYLEGDGFAWRTSSQPSDNPTPNNPVGLALALQHPAGAAAYLARPCQNVVPSDWSGCTPSDWTDARYSPAVVGAMTGEPVGDAGTVAPAGGGALVAAAAAAPGLSSAVAAAPGGPPLPLPTPLLLLHFGDAMATLANVRPDAAPQANVAAISAALAYIDAAWRRHCEGGQQAVARGAAAAQAAPVAAAPRAPPLSDAQLAPVLRFVLARSAVDRPVLCGVLAAVWQAQAGLDTRGGGGGGGGGGGDAVALFQAAAVWCVGAAAGVQ